MKKLIVAVTAIFVVSMIAKFAEGETIARFAQAEAKFNPAKKIKETVAKFNSEKNLDTAIAKSAVATARDLTEEVLKYAREKGAAKPDKIKFKDMTFELSDRGTLVFVDLREIRQGDFTVSGNKVHYDRGEDVSKLLEAVDKALPWRGEKRTALSILPEFLISVAEAQSAESPNAAKKAGFVAAISGLVIDAYDLAHVDEMEDNATLLSNATVLCRDANFQRERDPNYVPMDAVIPLEDGLMQTIVLRDASVLMQQSYCSNETVERDSKSAVVQKHEQKIERRSYTWNMCELSKKYHDCMVRLVDKVNEKALISARQLQVMKSNLKRLKPLWLKSPSPAFYAKLGENDPNPNGNAGPSQVK